MKIAGASVLVTGGGRGIGRYLVDRFEAESAQIAVLEREEVLCGELRNSHSGRIKAFACDVSDADSVDAALLELFDSGFEPEVLINNAGLIHSELLVNVLSREKRVHSLDSWRRVMGANLDSVFVVTSRVIDRMMAMRRKGIVISISSISARGNAGQSAYSAAKAGVNALTRAWAKELGALGYRFAAIAPGFIDTASTRAALSESIISRLQQQIPLRRLGEVEHIFLAVRHVIENDYINGTVLEVDGGLVI